MTEGAYKRLRLNDAARSLNFVKEALAAKGRQTEDLKDRLELTEQELSLALRESKSRLEELLDTQARLSEERVQRTRPSWKQFTRVRDTMRNDKQELIAARGELSEYKQKLAQARDDLTRSREELADTQEKLRHKKGLKRKLRELQQSVVEKELHAHQVRLKEVSAKCRFCGVLGGALVASLCKDCIRQPPQPGVKACLDGIREASLTNDANKARNPLGGPDYSSLYSSAKHLCTLIETMPDLRPAE